MFLRVIPRALFTSMALFLLAIPTFAQSNEARPRAVMQTVDSELNCAPEELDRSSETQATAAITNPRPAPKPVINLSSTTKSADSAFLKFQPQLLSAID